MEQTFFKLLDNFNFKLEKCKKNYVFSYIKRNKFLYAYLILNLNLNTIIIIINSKKINKTTK